MYSIYIIHQGQEWCKFSNDFFFKNVILILPETFYSLLQYAK